MACARPNSLNLMLDGRFWDGARVVSHATCCPLSYPTSISRLISTTAHPREMAFHGVEPSRFCGRLGLVTSARYVISDSDKTPPARVRVPDLKLADPQLDLCLPFEWETTHDTVRNN
jgi:hypothetical protein